MFAPKRSSSLFAQGFRMAELIFHATVRHVRRSHRNAIAGLLLSMLQSIIFVSVFYLMFSLIGVRSSPIPGDYLLYLMSGVFLFMFHTKAMSAVAMAEGPASTMMQHAPLNTFVIIAAAGLSSLYLQSLSLFALLFLYHAIFTPVVIDDPIGAFGMVLLSWFSGVAVGTVFYAIRPWQPDLGKILTTVWSRANMVASGKMFVANAMPGHLIMMFWWNPLFHVIDQARGFIFLNYSPQVTDWRYALCVSLAIYVIGMMGVSFTKKRASASWGAAR